MKLEAKARLEAATPVFAANIKDFMKSLFGPDAMKHFGKPRLSKDRRTWDAYYDGTLDEGVSSAISTTLGKPIFTARHTNFWVIPGKGYIVYDWEDRYIEITSATSPEHWVGLAVAFADANFATRFKRYDIDAEKKTLVYVPYENTGARQVLSDLKVAFRKLKLSGWKIKVGTGYYMG